MSRTPRGGFVPSGYLVTPPAGFTLDLPFSVAQYGRSFSPYNWDVSSLEPATTATMYVSPSGDDGNDGSSLVLAKRTIENAIGVMTQPTTIWLADGHYGENAPAGTGGHWRGATPNYSLSLKAINSGSVINSPHVYQLVWSVFFAPVYVTNYTNAVQSVYDGKYLTSSGDMVKLSQQGSIASVLSNAGSFFYTGTQIYVHLSDNRVPDSFVNVFRSMQSAFVSKDSITVYLEGIEFRGGPNGAVYLRNATVAGGLYAYAKNCKFKYSFATGGFACEGTTLSICQGCESASNDNDGYNYHVRNGVIPDAIEIGCTGRNNGTTGDADNNGSSIHDGGRIARIGGNYGYTYGSPVLDVGDSLSWNAGIEAHHGLSAGVANIAIDGTMWLDACYSHDKNATGYDLGVLGAGDALYHYDLASTGSFSVPGGTLAIYSPAKAKIANTGSTTDMPKKALRAKAKTRT